MFGVQVPIRGTRLGGRHSWVLLGNVGSTPVVDGVGVQVDGRDRVTITPMVIIYVGGFVGVFLDVYGSYWFFEFGVGTVRYVVGFSIRGYPVVLQGRVTFYSVRRRFGVVGGVLRNVISNTSVDALGGLTASSSKGTFKVTFVVKFATVVTLRFGVRHFKEVGVQQGRRALTIEICPTRVFAICLGTSFDHNFGQGPGFLALRFLKGVGVNNSRDNTIQYRVRVTFVRQTQQFKVGFVFIFQSLTHVFGLWVFSFPF